MKKRIIGNGGLAVSELGLGCMSLPSELQEARYVIDAAIDAGITYFDTADLYDKGHNEEIIGTLLKEKRKDLIIATKAGNRWTEEQEGWQWDPSKAHIMQAVKESLKRLEMDYIDLYQLHGGTMEDDADETIEAFEALKKEGVIREYGISSIRPNVIERFLKNSSAVSVMMQYSMLDRRPEDYFQMIERLGASVITRGTIAKGLLTDEAKKRVQKADGFASYNEADLKKTVEALAQTEHLQAYALAFVLQHSTVASALIGSRTKEQLAASIRAYNERIDDSVLQSLVQLTKEHCYEEHRV